jgi:hypothetical protein
VSRILKREGLNKLSKAQQAKFDAVSGEAICAQPPKAGRQPSPAKWQKLLINFHFLSPAISYHAWLLKKPGNSSVKPN